MWWDSSSARLSRVAFAAIADAANEVLLSTASIWEMQIKSQLGKLPLRVPLEQIIAEQQMRGIGIRPIDLTDIYRLGLYHRRTATRLIAS